MELVVQEYKKGLIISVPEEYKKIIGNGNYVVGSTDHDISFDELSKIMSLDYIDLHYLPMHVTGNINGSISDIVKKDLKNSNLVNNGYTKELLENEAILKHISMCKQVEGNIYLPDGNEVVDIVLRGAKISKAKKERLGEKRGEILVASGMLLPLDIKEGWGKRWNKSRGQREYGFGEIITLPNFAIPYEKH